LAITVSGEYIISRFIYTIGGGIADSVDEFVDVFDSTGHIDGE
jgi:hypothetical protein